MSLTIPSTQDLSNNVIAQLQTAFNQTIPILPRSFTRVLAKVLAGLLITLYKYSGFMFQQLFVSTATMQPTEVNGVIIRPLIEWGRLVGIGDPTAATQAELTITITVNTQGGTLPTGTQLIGPNGVTYLTTAAISLNAATVQGTVRASGDQNNGDGSGVQGNLENGIELQFTNAPGTVNRMAPVSGTVTTAADEESEENYRQRVLNRFQQRPQGGAYADYSDWGLGVAGIIGIFPYTGLPGRINVYAEATEASSGSPDGIPTAAQLQAVDDAIQLDVNGLATRRPAGSLVSVFAITRVSFDVVVTGLDVDNQASVETQITEAVEQYFLAAEPFITGLTIPQRTDRITDTAISGVVEDVVTANGGVFTGITFSRTGIGIDIPSYALGEGEKAKANSVTYP